MRKLLNLSIDSSGWRGLEWSETFVAWMFIYASQQLFGPHCKWYFFPEDNWERLEDAGTLSLAKYGGAFPWTHV